MRLTPAGRRLADHAVTILAALETARCDLDPDATPAGRAARGGVRDRGPPVVAAGGAGGSRRRTPTCGCMIHEHEPVRRSTCWRPTTWTWR